MLRIREAVFQQRLEEAPTRGKSDSTLHPPPPYPSPGFVRLGSATEFCVLPPHAESFLSEARDLG